MSEIMTKNVKKFSGKYMAKKFPISRGELSEVAYIIHKIAKEDGTELERPMKVAKAVLKFLGYEINDSDNQD